MPGTLHPSAGSPGQAANPFLPPPPRQPLVQGDIHANSGTLQHGHAHRPVHPGQAHARLARQVQGTPAWTPQGWATADAGQPFVPRCQSVWFGGGKCLCDDMGPARGCTTGHTSPLPTPLPARRLQVDIALAPGSHDSEAAVNKQLADKERVAAALENPNLLEMVNACTAGVAGDT